MSAKQRVRKIPYGNNHVSTSKHGKPILQQQSTRYLALAIAVRLDDERPSLLSDWLSCAVAVAAVMRGGASGGACRCRSILGG